MWKKKRKANVFFDNLEAAEQAENTDILSPYKIVMANDSLFSHPAEIIWSHVSGSS